MLSLTRLMSKSGASIIQMNTVRKEIEILKGGGLAKLAQPARVGMLYLTYCVHLWCETFVCISSAVFISQCRIVHQQTHAKPSYLFLSLCSSLNVLPTMFVSDSFLHVFFNISFCLYILPCRFLRKEGGEVIWRMMKWRRRVRRRCGGLVSWKYSIFNYKVIVLSV